MKGMERSPNAVASAATKKLLRYQRVMVLRYACARLWNYLRGRQGKSMAVGLFKKLKLSMSGTLIKRVDAHIDAGTMAAATTEPAPLRWKVDVIAKPGRNLREYCDEFEDP
jgi:hypothetical protein